jgi:hypothetical protein
MMSTEEHSWLVHQSSLANSTTSHLVSNRRYGRKEWKFNIAKYFCSYLQVICTCRKILRHGGFSFTSPPKEGVLRIFMALKSPSPRPGFNPLFSVLKVLMFCLYSSPCTFHFVDSISTWTCLSFQKNLGAPGRITTTSGYRTALYVSYWSEISPL